MKPSNQKKLAVAVSVCMLFSPLKINGLEYKTLPPEPVKIEEQKILKRKK